jgi:hypothetical protein
MFEPRRKGSNARAEEFGQNLVPGAVQEEPFCQDQDSSSDGLDQEDFGIERIAKESGNVADHDKADLFLIDQIQHLLKPETVGG